MADHKRATTGANPPIRQHPLFPVIVALWLAALFGLGSLAIPPALVERLVALTGIDRAVPMAAPPLGMTARILVSLAVTGLGAVLGFALARRLATPKPASRESDPVVASDDTQLAEAAADSLAGQTTDPEAEPVAPPSRLLALRRRSLTAAEPDAIESSRKHDELPEAALQAPILDVADLDDDGPKVFASVLSPSSQRELEHGAFVSPVVHPAPADGEDNPDGESTGDVPAASRLGYRLFDAYAPAIPSPDENVSIGAATIGTGTVGADIDLEFHEDADGPVIGAQRDEAAPAPGFQLLESAAQLADPFGSVDLPEAAGAPDAGNDRLPVTIGTTSPAPAAPSASNVLSILDAFAPAVELDAIAAPTGSVAERIAAADLDTLSSVELLERLALAMERRRAASASGSVHAEAQARNVLMPAESVVTGERPVNDIDDAAPQASISRASGDMPEGPTGFSSMDDAPFARPTVSIAPVAMIQSDDSPESGIAPFAGLASFAQVPAALRPVGLDAHIDEEDALPGYVPPRHIGQAVIAEPAPFAAPFAAPVNGPVDSHAAPVMMTRGGAMSAADAEYGDDTEEDVLGAGYSSLLNLTRNAPARQNFVRIENPDLAEDAEPFRPSVVFPGEQAELPSDGGVSAPEDMPGQVHSAHRRPFDAPVDTDVDETERALRAALATLQRMSGAA